MSEVKLHNISFQYKESNPLFNNLNLSFNKGDFCFVLGANGSGKSTLLGLLLGKNTPDSGTVLFNDQPIKKSAMLSAMIGYIPQEQSLDGEMTVSDIIDFNASFYFLFGKKLRQKKAQLVNDLDIGDLLSKRIKKLSGGQKQLVNISLGLIHSPEIILLDEPFVGLDFDKTNKLVTLLKGLNKTILCVSHNIDIAERYADSIVLLKDGIVLEKGNPDKIVKSNPYVFQEIELKNIFDIKLPETINWQLEQNKLTLSYQNKENLLDKVNTFLKGNSINISEIRTSKNTLKSSIIGLHNVSLSTNEKKLVKKGGKGDGTGGGNKKQKA